MKIRVGRIPYLNSEPFYYNLIRDDIELFSLVPSALAQAAERGEIDAGPIPLVDYFRLQDRFTRAGAVLHIYSGKVQEHPLLLEAPLSGLGRGHHRCYR